MFDLDLRFDSEFTVSFVAGRRLRFAHLMILPLLAISFFTRQGSWTIDARIPYFYCGTKCSETKKIHLNNSFDSDRRGGAARMDGKKEKNATN